MPPSWTGDLLDFVNDAHDARGPVLDLSTLNREQTEAVLHTEGPMLVLAGAGSGKTRVITFRLANLIRHGVSPTNILCVTFTNKAAFEMRTRARDLVGRTLKGATMSTFHALGARILRDMPEKVGLRPGFTISDGAEQIGTVRRIIRDLSIYDRRFDAERVMSLISKAKNAGWAPEVLRERGGFGTSDDADEDYIICAIESYERYQESLRIQNVIDFDDLLLLTQRLLETDGEVRERLQARWHYLMIDEYQDTNGAQFSLMEILAGERRNLCVVGDDDQSIYGWRGADLGNILRFHHDFSGAKIVKLETNYRSTGCILQLANAVIHENKGRHEKTMRAHAGPGDPVRLVSVEDEDAEAELVAREVFGLESKNVPPKEIAVLFRSNVQSRALELAFRTMGIKYRVSGGQDLFDKKEVKDFTAYLRLLDNPDDEQSLRRIINFPARGIGATTVDRAEAFAQAHKLSLYEALHRIDEVEGVAAKAQDAVMLFVAMIDELRKGASRRKVSTTARKLLEDTKLLEVLHESSDNPQSASRRVDNVKELVRQIERYEARVRRKREKAEGPTAADAEGLEAEELFADFETEATLSGFLSEMALGTREDGTSKEDRDDQVVLSTIHASKGLEWSHVFLVGCEEEFLPHKKNIDVGSEVEEERRLMYVAITRARSELTLSWARNRTKYGQIVPRARSRFLDKLPEDAVSVFEDGVAVARTDEERDAIARQYMADIRSKLGLA